MKKRIISALLATLTILSCIFGMSFVSGAEKATVVNENMSQEQACLDKMTYAGTSENGVFELYVAEETLSSPNIIKGEIGVKNTLTGEIMLSNPTDAKDNYRSQLLFKYYSKNSPNNIVEEFSSKAGKTVVTIEDGRVHVDYMFGVSDEEETEIILPEQISYSTWQWMLEEKAKLEEKIDNGESDFKFPGLTKRNFKDLYQKSAFVSDDMSYMLGRNINSYLSLSTKKIVGDVSYTAPIENSIWYNTVTQDRLRKQYATVLAEIGFTKEMMEEEYEKIGYVVEDEEEATARKFTISAFYEVNNEGFNADVDTSKIEYDKENVYITSVTLLPYMSAAKGDSTGYTFIPDGSGVLLRFEESKANVLKPVYGNDFAYYEIGTTEKNSEQVVFPVFGLVNNSKANSVGYFAVIENGDAISSIESRNNNDYHSAMATFAIGMNDKYGISDSLSSDSSSLKDIYIDAENIYRGKCSVKYTMLMSDYTADKYGVESYYQTSYVGMADCYRDYLYKNGSLTKLSDVKENTKFFLEAFGSISVTEKVLTFPVKVNKELTTFENVKEIYNELSENGVDNIDFILTGFANGGLQNIYPSKINWIGKLGGKKGFNDLLSYANSKGFTVSPNFDFSYTRDEYSNFSLSKMSSRTLDNRYTTKREYNTSTGVYMRTGAVVVSSGSFDIAYEKFSQSSSKYHMNSIAPRTMGSDLNSSLSEKNFISREDAKTNAVSMLSKLSKESGYKLILDKGNAYTLPYASGILNVGIDSSMLSNTSETVPFVGLVLHGSVEFSGKAINTEGDERHALLRSLENGSVLYYTVAKQNVYALKDSRYNNYYSVSYDILKDQIVDLYSEYNTLMKSKQDKYIVEHEFMNAKYGFDVTRVEDGASLNNSRVVRVEYENGEGFILNYNSYDIKVVYDGTTYEISSLSYATYVK